MTDSKTEWRAEQSPTWVWRVAVYQGDKRIQIISSGLDKPTALKIAAVNEMEAALAYQTRVLASFNASNLHSAGMERAVKRGMAALAKARGESDD